MRTKRKMDWEDKCLVFIACLAIVLAVLPAIAWQVQEEPDLSSCKEAIWNDGFTPTTFEQNQAWKKRVEEACKG